MKFEVRNQKTATRTQTWRTESQNSGSPRIVNPILMGKAEDITPKVRASIKRVLQNEGFYIATDVSQPGAEIPLVSIDGKLFCMKVDTELAPERFFATVRFKGPFRADSKK